MIAYCASCNDDHDMMLEQRKELILEIEVKVRVLICPKCGSLRDAPGFDSMAAYYEAKNER